MDDLDDNATSALHVAMFPWLAMGHFIPFLELSKCLAERGHRISFISTPRNIQRLPKIPPKLSHLIDFVVLPLPSIEGLPEDAEASVDIPINKAQLLKMAFDGLESPITAFLKSSSPDWILLDYASHWLPPILDELGLPWAYFSLFTAAMLSFFGSPDALINNQRLSIEDFTKSPNWIPFESNVAYRYHEMAKFFEAGGENESNASDFYRFGVAVRDSKFVALRSCVEFEPEWIALLAEIYQKPIIPVGSLYPFDHSEEHNNNWVSIRSWLDQHKAGTVVYVALGTEASLSQAQLTQLALGLEQSELPFFWVLRKPPSYGPSRDSEDDDWVKAVLPEGFVERVRERGVVHAGWAPQVNILSHDSVGGFLTHCGWNSVVEALGVGQPLVLLPVMNDQGLNARLLEGKKVGVEIGRDERDGSFTSDSVAESVRRVVVDSDGEALRARAREMREVFAGRVRMDRYIDDFVGYLKRFGRPNRPDSAAIM
ncbi:hypothetical protein Sjap_022339 [Stephania japonica]|uniref:Glycosyltransferase n=1 Tax=Stephania japonica TaxID=461633 RepID=A0AAP0EU27_9MAGN